MRILHEHCKPNSKTTSASTSATSTGSRSRDSLRLRRTGRRRKSAKNSLRGYGRNWSSGDISARQATSSASSIRGIQLSTWTSPRDFAALKAGIVDEINRRIFGNRIVNARERRELRFRKEVQLSPGFQHLWERIKHRTRYRVTFETADLIERALSFIRQMAPIKPPRVATTVVAIDMSDAGVSADRHLATRIHDVAPVNELPDILAFLQKETELTRHTLAQILRRSERLSEFKVNPHAFMAAVSREIVRAMNDLMLDGIKYERMTGKYWEQSRIEKEAADGLVRYLSNLYEVQNHDKCLFDAIEYESEVERQFARDLDHNESVRLFVKLPGWFRIDTPIGPYNPDWAFVTERDKRLYFVRETKSTLDSEERRVKENKKIVCGRKHFGAIDVDYDVVTSLSEVPM